MNGRFFLLFFFLFQRERAHSCGHFPGPESFIRPLSLEKGQKEVSKSSNVHILTFQCAKQVCSVGIKIKGYLQI